MQQGIPKGRSMARRRRIIETAQHLFLRDGIRATTMEAIARESAVAKQTLYTHFPDKDAVVVAVVGAIVDALCGTVDLGLDGEGSVADRVGQALAGKFVAIRRLVGISPHAEEIFGEHARLAHRFNAMDEATERQVAAVLSAAGVADSNFLGRQLIAASYGLGRKLGSDEEIHVAIMTLCNALIQAHLPVSEAVTRQELER